MEEIIYHVEGILQNYNLTFNELSKCPNKLSLEEASGPERIQQLISRRFHKTVGINDAKELEILFLTYNYLSHN